MVETPRENAAQRARELKELRRRLRFNEPITQRDIETAAEAAERARLRAIKAHLSAAEAHRESADAHRCAADVYDLAADQNIGDITAHRKAADRHRRAAETELQSALKADRKAKQEP